MGVRAAEAGHRDPLKLALLTITHVKESGDLSGFVHASAVQAGPQQQGLLLTRRDRGKAAAESSHKRDQLLLVEGGTAGTSG